MAKKPARAAEPKLAKVAHPIEINATPIIQGGKTLYSFVMSAKDLWEIASINRRERDKETGYQRVLPQSRVSAISEYITAGWNIPNSVILALEGAKYDDKTKTLRIPAGENVAWVIDGQHRLAGAHEAMTANKALHYEFPVVAFTDLDEDQQVEQFVTINREAKGVPASLVLDLLDRIPKKKPADLANERAADIAKSLDRDASSPFFQRIVIDRPQGRQVSLVNFTRKVAPLVNVERGRLRGFSFEQQKLILENYFLAIRDVFRSEWEKKEAIFFKTVGFGAMLNVFEEIFNVTTEQKGSFTVEDAVDTLKLVADFEFDQWAAHGTGTKAESEAAKDFSIDFGRALDRKLKRTGTEKIRLK